MKSSFIIILSIFFIFLITLVSVQKFLKSESLVQDDAIATITTDSESELLDAVKTLNSNGGTIYIKTPVINISSQSTINLSGSIAGGIVGMKLSDGAYPRIDFTKARESGSTKRSFTISGSNQYIISYNRKF